MMSALSHEDELQEASGFKELFGFSRSYTRQRYWGVKITAFFANFGISFLIGLMTIMSPKIMVLAVLVGAACAWISFVTTLKRLRDADLSLYWALLALLPGLNIITLIIYGCIGSSDKKNTGSAKGVFAVLIASILVLAVLLGMMTVVGMSAIKHRHVLAAHMQQLQAVSPTTVAPAPVSVTTPAQ